MSKIDHIGKLTPNAILADTLQEVEDIDFVVLFVGKKDNTSYVSWSRCELRDTAFEIQILQRQFNKALDDEPPSRT